MSIVRRSRFVFWLITDLVTRYTKLLILGFFIGLFSSIGLIRVWPLIQNTIFKHINYVGVVGDYELDDIPKQITANISSGLTALDEDGSVKPALAVSWETNDNGKNYVFHLRKNIKWHDGSDFEAKDINYNIKQVKFNVIDKYTVKAELETPYSPFLTLVTRPIFKTGLIGNGPMRVASFKRKGEKLQRLKLIPRDDTVAMNTTEYKFYITEATAIMAFKLGEIDEITDLSTDANIRNMRNVQIRNKTNYNRILTLFFNISDPFLSEKKHRQGLGYALPDVTETDATGPIPMYSWAYYDKVKKYTPDLSQAKKLLGDLEATDSAMLTITTFPLFLDESEAIAASWSAIGVKTSVRITNAKPDNYQVFLAPFDVPPDPDQYVFWHSTQNNTNITGYANPRIDKLLEEGRRETDPGKRKQIYTDFQRYLIDDAPAIFLYYLQNYTLLR